jgi:hypothetical protein
MKWIKHMTASWDDEKMAKLAGAGGMEGLAMYGLYWRVQEIIAGQMEGKEPKCSVHYSVTRWSLLLSLRGSLVFSTLSRLGVTGLVTVERDGDDVRVTNRNLLKYRDEYARKSGHSQDNVRPRTELEGEGELDTETDKEILAQNSNEFHADKPKSAAKRRPAKARDARHAEFKQILSEYWAAKNQDEMPWDGSEAKGLSQLLAANPKIDGQRFRHLLRNRFKSEVNHTKRPREWVACVTDYANGPLDKYKNPLEVNNGKTQRSGAPARVNSAYDALDHAVERKGWGVAGDPTAADGSEIPAPGPFGVDAGATVRLRGAGDSVRAEDSAGRAGGAADPPGPEVFPPTRPSSRGV